MRTVAILPIKTFSEAKQRLGSGLSTDERRALVEAMFCDVLVALGRVAALEQTVVVSGHELARRIASGHGATVIDDDEQGHNAAAARGVRAAIGQGYDRVLLVPGDCPALDPAEVGELLARPAGQRSAVIVPDRHGTGTNALLLAPPDVLAPSFGPDSRRRHLARARDRGIAAEVVEVPTLGLDVDTPEDLEAVRRRLDSTPGGAAHTRGLLGRLLRAGP